MATSKNSVSADTTNRTNKIPISVIVILALALFAGFGFYWWREVYSNPRNVFKSMLNNSLRLSAITKTVAQGGQGQSVRQVTRLNLTAKPVVISETMLAQGQGTAVTTESIGTPTEDFVRYKNIKTDQKSANGGDLDFSTILGVWGSQEGMASSQTDGELYNETVMGIVPFGNLTAAQRRELLDFIEDQRVYEVNYDYVTREIVNGRPTYTFEVGVDAQAYVKALKKFAQMTGLNNLDELNPDDYAGQDRLPFKVGVDVWSHQLKQIENVQSAKVEAYSGQNAVSAVEIPTNAISVQELQDRLSKIE